MTQTQDAAQDSARDSARDRAGRHAGFATETRTVTWATPGQGDVGALAELDGLGQLRAMLDGTVGAPPIGDLLGFGEFRVERGRVEVDMEVSTAHYNPLGTVHGGALATMLDTGCGCAVQSVLEVGERYTSLDLTVKFLRAATVDSGTLTCVGTVIQRGRRTALAQAQLTDSEGRLVAHATSSCMIFS